MKTLSILVSLFIVTVSASASPTKLKTVKASNVGKVTAEVSTSKTVPPQSMTKTQLGNSVLSTDVRFGDQSVGGKYQLPMEALSVVENEKSIDDLIGVRKNFQDRVTRTKGMR